MNEIVAAGQEHFSFLPDLVANHALARPSSVAVIDDQRSMTYAALDRLADRIAASLQRDGLRKGAVIALVSATTIAALSTMLGALKAGCVTAPMAPSLTPDQLRRMIADCAAQRIFVDAGSRGLLLGDPASVIDVENLEGWLVPDGEKPAHVNVCPADSFSIIYSSGTTGTPKGIVQSHAMRWRQIEPYRQLGIADGIMMVATPIYSHTTLASLLPTLAFGGTVVLLRSFDAGSFLEIASRERATHAMLVPAQYQRIMAHPDFDNYDLSAFRLKAAAGAPFPVELKRDVLRRWPGALIEIYGMTEGGGTCLLYADEHPDKLHSVGRPAPGNDIRIIDAEGRELSHGEIGEVVGRSGAMMTGYHNREAATQESAWFDEEGNRFMRHGDLGYFDEEGFLILSGRLKDMIISGGFNIYPSDLESIALEHPAVADAAVVGKISERWGESPFLFYVERRGGVSPDELVGWVNERVSKTQRLVGATPLAELPRNAIGKVLKRELRELCSKDPLIAPAKLKSDSTVRDDLSA